MLLLAAVLFTPPAPGTYVYPLLPEVKVTVLDEVSARVDWTQRRSAAVVYDGRRVILGEPLAEYARRANVEINEVRPIAGSQKVRVGFDGPTMRFSVVLVAA